MKAWKNILVQRTGVVALELGTVEPARLRS
jgi:hypothetical protein